MMTGESQTQSWDIASVVVVVFFYWPRVQANTKSNNNNRKVHIIHKRNQNNATLLCCKNTQLFYCMWQIMTHEWRIWIVLFIPLLLPNKFLIRGLLLCIWDFCLRGEFAATYKTSKYSIFFLNSTFQPSHYNESDNVIFMQILHGHIQIWYYIYTALYLLFVPSCWCVSDDWLSGSGHSLPSGWILQNARLEGKTHQEQIEGTHWWGELPGGGRRGPQRR